MSRKLIICTAMAILMAMAMVPGAYALVPHFISYQGKLTRETPRGAIPLSGTYTVTFRIYDADGGGNTLWGETRDVEVNQGIFNVTLGEVTPLDLTFDQDYWLGLQVDPDPEMTPRQRMVSAGYSYMAEDSYYLGGEEPSYYAVATHAHTFSEIKGTISDAQVPDDITIDHATTADEADLARGMKVLASAPASASAGEIYFDTTQLKAYIYDGTNWNEYKGDKGDTGAQGPQGPKGNTGATGPRGPQGPSNLWDNYSITRIRDCCQTSHGGDFACIVWPWSVAACKKWVCSLHARWAVNAFYPNGTWAHIDGGSCP